MIGLVVMVVDVDVVGLNSGRALQGGRQCTHHEAEFLQSDSVESFTSSYSVSAQGAGVEGWGTVGAPVRLVYHKNVA